MSMHLSIKNAPDLVVERLRARAVRNHRSLQGELMAIVTAAVADEPSCDPLDILAEAQRLDLGSTGEAVSLIRADRDGDRRAA